MRLTPPKKTTFWISIILGALGLIGYLVTIPLITSLAFWLVLAGLVILVLGLLLKGF
jgi:hypothetical protein